MNFDEALVALVRPGTSPISTVSFQDTAGTLRMGMTLAGVLSNGDEVYKYTFVYERGSISETMSTAWGSKKGQFNIIATGDSEHQSHTYPYLEIGLFPQQDNTLSRKDVIPISYNSTARYTPQVIMAGYSPALLDKNDDQFDIIAIVRPGNLPIQHVSLKQQGKQFNMAMEFVGELSNGDQVYKLTYIFGQGGLNDIGEDALKNLWGPNQSQFGIEVADEGNQRSHRFPDIEFGDYPEYKKPQ